MRDSRDDRLLHQLLLTDDPGSLVAGERRADVDADSVVAGELDRAQHQHLRAGCGQLEHLLVRDRVQLARLRHDAWIGREDALDVGVDLARVRPERGRERDGGRVGAAPAERRHLVRGRDALEAGDEHDRALLERIADPPRPDLEHLRARVLGVRDDAGLRAGQRDRGVPEVVDRHRGERARDPLADREQHVELARMRRGRDLVGNVDELVGRPRPSPRGRRRRRCRRRARPRAGARPPSAAPAPRRTCRRTSGRRDPWADATCASLHSIARRGARAVESGGLENRWACKRPVGSNPTPAATSPWSILSRIDCGSPRSPRQRRELARGE